MVELRHKVLGTIGAEKEEEKMELADLQSLIELGSIKEEVVIGKFKFLLRSLSASEREEISKEFKDNLHNEMFSFHIRLLAMAIELVNDQPLEVLYPNDYSDPLEAKMKIIASLQTPVINKLMATYTNILERCDKQFSLGQVKN